MCDSCMWRRGYPPRDCVFGMVAFGCRENDVNKAPCVPCRGFLQQFNHTMSDDEWREIINESVAGKKYLLTGKHF